MLLCLRTEYLSVGLKELGSARLFPGVPAAQTASVASWWPYCHLDNLKVVLGKSPWHVVPTKLLNDNLQREGKELRLPTARPGFSEEKSLHVRVRLRVILRVYLTHMTRMNSLSPVH